VLRPPARADDGPSAARPDGLTDALAATALDTINLAADFSEGRAEPAADPAAGAVPAASVWPLPGEAAALLAAWQGTAAAAASASTSASAASPAVAAAASAVAVPEAASALGSQPARSRPQDGSGAPVGAALSTQPALFSRNDDAATAAGLWRGAPAAHRSGGPVAAQHPAESAQRRSVPAATTAATAMATAPGGDDDMNAGATPPGTSPPDAVPAAPFTPASALVAPAAEGTATAGPALAPAAAHGARNPITPAAGPAPRSGPPTAGATTQAADPAADPADVPALPTGAATVVDAAAPADAALASERRPATPQTAADRGKATAAVGAPSTNPEVTERAAVARIAAQPGSPAIDPAASDAGQRQVGLASASTGSARALGQAAGATPARVQRDAAGDDSAFNPQARAISSEGAQAMPAAMPASATATAAVSAAAAQALAREASGGLLRNPVAEAAGRSGAAAGAGSTPMPSALAWVNAAQAGLAAPIEAPTVGHIAASPGSADFAPQLAAHITTFIRDGLQHARLELNPAEMGPLTVQIQLDGNAARVHMAAEHAGTRAALEQAMPQLAGSLREGGLTLSGGGVFEQPRQPQSQAQPQPQAGNGGHGDGAGRGTTQAGRDAASPALGGATGPSGNWGRRQAGLVDLVA
jgi:flagellar hook-length control protein FliK